MPRWKISSGAPSTYLLQSYVRHDTHLVLPVDQLPAEVKFKLYCSEVMKGSRISMCVAQAQLRKDKTEGGAVRQESGSDL